MKFLGSKLLETERLIIKPQTIEEQKRLWEILMIPEINKYFLTVPPKFGEKLKDWKIQKEYYEKDMEYAFDNNTFRWSIFLKDTGVCIGRISCQDGDSGDPNVRDIGWLIDPDYQRQGYAFEAASAVLDFMFNECEIDKIVTSAAIVNSASWKLMEKLGFEKQKNNKFVQYTYVLGLTENYVYVLDKFSK